jgi:hypothetical protein
MRALFAQCNGDRERTINAYAEAERRREVRRDKNTHGLTAEQYASALFADGIRKGWLA